MGIPKMRSSRVSETTIKNMGGGGHARLRGSRSRVSRHVVTSFIVLMLVVGGITAGNARDIGSEDHMKSLLQVPNSRQHEKTPSGTCPAEEKSSHEAAVRTSLPLPEETASTSSWSRDSPWLPLDAFTAEDVAEKTIIAKGDTEADRLLATSPLTPTEEGTATELMQVSSCAVPSDAPSRILPPAVETPTESSVLVRNFSAEQHRYYAAPPPAQMSPTDMQTTGTRGGGVYDILKKPLESTCAATLLDSLARAFGSEREPTSSGTGGEGAPPHAAEQNIQAALEPPSYCRATFPEVVFLEPGTGTASDPAPPEENERSAAEISVDEVAPNTSAISVTSTLSEAIPEQAGTDSALPCSLPEEILPAVAATSEGETSLRCPATFRGIILAEATAETARASAPTVEKEPTAVETSLDNETLNNIAGFANPVLPGAIPAHADTRRTSPLSLYEEVVPTGAGTFDDKVPLKTQPYDPATDLEFITADPKAEAASPNLYVSPERTPEGTKSPGIVASNAVVTPTSLASGSDKNEQTREVAAAPDVATVLSCSWKGDVTTFLRQTTCNRSTASCMDGMATPEQRAMGADANAEIVTAEVSSEVGAADAEILQAATPGEAQPTPMTGPLGRGAENIDPQLERLVREFNSWARSVDFPVRKVEAGVVGGGMRVGLIATEPLEEGQPYLSVPDSIILDAEKAKADPELGSALMKLGAALSPLDSWNDDTDNLLVLLVKEAFAEVSRWGLYLRLMPSVSDVKSYHPLFFDDDTIELLEGSDIRAAVRRYRDYQVASFHRKFGDEVDGGRPLDEALGAGWISLERYLWATAILDSRVIWWDGRTHLVPLLDIVNNGQGPPGAAVHETVQDSDGHTVTTASWSFDKGDQVLEDYGNPNHDLFLHHGFSLASESRHDCVRIDAERPRPGPQQWETLTRIQEAFPGGRPMFCISLRHNGPYDFVSYVRIMAGLSTLPESSPDYSPLSGTTSSAEGEISSSDNSAVEEGPAEGPWEDLRPDPEGLRAVMNFLGLRLAGYPQRSEKSGESLGDGSGGDPSSGLATSAVELSVRAFLDSEQSLLRELHDYLEAFLPSPPLPQRDSFNSSDAYEAEGTETMGSSPEGAVSSSTSSVSKVNIDSGTGSDVLQTRIPAS